MSTIQNTTECVIESNHGKSQSLIIKVNDTKIDIIDHNQSKSAGFSQLSLPHIVDDDMDDHEDDHDLLSPPKTVNNPSNTKVKTMRTISAPLLTLSDTSLAAEESANSSGDSQCDQVTPKPRISHIRNKELMMKTWSKSVPNLVSPRRNLFRESDSEFWTEDIVEKEGREMRKRLNYLCKQESIKRGKPMFGMKSNKHSNRRNKRYQSNHQLEMEEEAINEELEYIRGLQK